MRKKFLHFSAAIITSCVLLVGCSKDSMVMPAKSTAGSDAKVSQSTSSPASSPSNSNNNSGGCNHGGGYTQNTGS